MLLVEQPARAGYHNHGDNNVDEDDDEDNKMHHYTAVLSTDGPPTAPHDQQSLQCSIRTASAVTSSPAAGGHVTAVTSQLRHLLVTCQHFLMSRVKMAARKRHVDSLG